MTRATVYPEADTRSQWFARTHPGDVMPHPNVVVLHTTEGSTWPTYSGGAVAPTLTYWAGHGWRQHFPLNMSARALENASGGVETNTLNVIQVELVGTCAAGGPGLHWPSASDADLAPLAEFLRWLAGEWPVPLESTSRPWLPYPSSYGGSKARMTRDEWLSFSGICGHQHVPENHHGDPGDFPIDRLLWLAGTHGGRGMSAPIPAPLPTTQEAPMGKTLTEDDFDEIGNRVHSQALTASYGEVDGQPYTAAAAIRDILNGVRALQASFDPAKFAAAVTAHLPSGVVSDAQLEAVVRRVLGSVDDVPVQSSGN